MKGLAGIGGVRRWRVSVIVIVICLLDVSVVLGSGNLFMGGSGGNTVEWYYWSPLDVTEVITDIGGASYRYEYSFVNTDTSPIYDFAVITTFVAEPENPFAQRSTWEEFEWVPAGETYAEYDARNLDPDIVGFIGIVSDPPFDAAAAIQVGEAVSGLSFTAAVYDDSPKYYFYETIASGYTQTNGTGKVAAVGLTPEPGTVLLLGLGGLGVLRKRKA